jgi:glucokinase
VDAEGVVLSAPPLWGTRARRVPLRRLLERRTGLAVTVANDLCGTALYYGRHPDFAAGCELLMVVALGTGVGCKTYDVRRGCLVMGAGGRGGEIGHINVEPAPAALPCDCGAAGHLSSYVSGRGIARLAAYLAEADPAGYRRSPLCGREEGPSIRVLPRAAARKDPFACRILDIAAEKLAAAFQAATGTLGVDRYVLVGGLALALGDELGRRVTQRLREKGVFGWTDRELGKLVRVGVPSDDAALLGASWLAEPEQAREAA